MAMTMTYLIIFAIIAIVLADVFTTSRRKRRTEQRNMARRERHLRAQAEAEQTNLKRDG